MSNTVTNQGKTIDQIDSIDEKITDAGKKATFIDNGVLPLNGPAGGETSATTRQTLGVPVSELVPDVSGKADKSEMSITDVTGDATKKNIQLKAGTSTDVLVAHQDLSQYYTKSESNEAFVSKTGYVAYTTDEKNKLGGIEPGAEVNKIESISIEGTTVVPDENKNISIGIYSGTGGLVWDDDGGLYIPTDYPLYRGSREHPGIYFGYDSSTLELNDDDNLSVKYDDVTIVDNGNGLSVKYDDDTIVDNGNGLSVKYDDDTIVDNGNGLEVANPMPECDNTTEGILVHHSGGLLMDAYYEWIYAGTTIKLDGTFDVANPVPDTGNANDGDVLTYNGNTDEIVWAAPQGSSLPAYTQSDAGKVLAVNQAGDGVEWTNAGGGNGAEIIRFNTDTKTATYNGNTITPAEVVALYKQGHNLILSTYNVLDNVEYDKGNYYPTDLDEGEEHSQLNFVSIAFGTGGAGTTNYICAEGKYGYWGPN